MWSASASSSTHAAHSHACLARDTALPAAPLSPAGVEEPEEVVPQELEDNPLCPTPSVLPLASTACCCCLRRLRPPQVVVHIPRRQAPHGEPGRQRRHRVCPAAAAPTHQAGQQSKRFSLAAPHRRARLLSLLLLLRRRGAQLVQRRDVSAGGAGGRQAAHPVGCRQRLRHRALRQCRLEGCE
jgi:hypothetical protein